MSRVLDSDYETSARSFHFHAAGTEEGPLTVTAPGSIRLTAPKGHAQLSAQDIDIRSDDGMAGFHVGPMSVLGQAVPGAHHVLTANGAAGTTVFYQSHTAGSADIELSGEATEPFPKIEITAKTIPEAFTTSLMLNPKFASLAVETGRLTVSSIVVGVDSITLRCGSNKIEVTSKGIVMKGLKVDLEAVAGMAQKALDLSLAAMAKLETKGPIQNI